MTRRGAFVSAYRQLEKRIGLFARLPIGELDRLTLRQKVEEIGNTDSH